MTDIRASASQPDHSDRDSSPSQPPAKVRKTKDGPKHRRAAHACDQCRNQKLRCQPSAESAESRCQRCLKWDLKCEFTTARSAENKPSAEKEGTEASKSFVKRGPILSRDARIAKLEELVGALIREGSQDDSTSGTASTGDTVGRLRTPSTNSLPASAALYNDKGRDALYQPLDFGSPRQNAQLQTGNSITYTAQTAQIPLQQNTLYTSGGTNHQVSHLESYTTATNSSNTTLPQAFPFQNTPSDASSTLPSGQFTSFGVPPLASTSQASEGGAKSPPTRSRPIPRVAAAYRMATLTDPSSHEAPFRPLTYHPDIFKNSEMSRHASPEPSALSNGRRTPKSGKGDAIELGIFTEEQARALFAL